MGILGGPGAMRPKRPVPKPPRTRRWEQGSDSWGLRYGEKVTKQTHERDFDPFTRI